MVQRDATNSEWVAAIKDIRERLAKFIKESAGRAQTPEDKEYVQQQGQQISMVLKSFAKRFDAEV